MTEADDGARSILDELGFIGGASGPEDLSLRYKDVLAEISGHDVDPPGPEETSTPGG